MYTVTVSRRLQLVIAIGEQLCRACTSYLMIVLILRYLSNLPVTVSVLPLLPQR